MALPGSIGSSGVGYTLTTGVPPTSAGRCTTTSLDSPAVTSTVEEMSCVPSLNVTSWLPAASSSGPTMVPSTTPALTCFPSTVTVTVSLGTAWTIAILPTVALAGAGAGGCASLAKLVVATVPPMTRAIETAATRTVRLLMVTPPKRGTTSRFPLGTTVTTGDVVQPSPSRHIPN